MKNILTLCLLGLVLQGAYAQTNLNIEKLGGWDNDTMPSDPFYHFQYSGCWGLTVNGHEIAVLGGALDVLFFDVTNPAQPDLIGSFRGTKKTAWREFKSYKNRVYAVSDATEEGLMIFDLNNAPDTIIRSYWSNAFFKKAHTITLDTISGKIYLNGSNVANSGLLILDASQTPDSPTLVANISLEGAYIHDSYVRNDTIYASSGSEGLYVFDCSDPESPVLLSNISTGGYNHNVWLNSAGTYAYYTEEVPTGLPIRIVDLQNLDIGSIEVVGSFLDAFHPAETYYATPHNVYIRGNLLFDSQYEDGLLVYDISVPTAPVLVGHYDTYPSNTQYNAYIGNWGNYPWLPSGNIIVGDTQNGLMMLKLSVPTATNQPALSEQFVISPNPAREKIRIDLRKSMGDWQYSLYNQQGTLLQSGTEHGVQTKEIETANLPAGLYIVVLRDDKGQMGAQKVMIR